MLRLHTSSTGLDPASLVPGRDLVLQLHPVHGLDAPAGTSALDHLSPAERREADLTALAAYEDWRRRLDPQLTVDGISWPFVWQLPVYELLNPAVARALALRAAVRDHAPGRIVLADTDPGTALLAEAVGRGLGLPVERDPAARAPLPPLTLPPPVPRGRRVRQAALRAPTSFGAPTLLRRDSTVFRSYWPLMPALDRMLEDRSLRPAIFLDKRPTGVGRTLRAARRGGWIGVPTPLDRRRARPVAERMLEAVRADERLEVDGIELGPWLQPLLADVVRRRAVGDLADAAMLRRALRGRPPAWIVGPFDTIPHERLVVLLARQAGVRTLMLSHGAYLLPEPFADLDICDEVALWTREVAPSITNWDRPIHLVGYPLPHDVPPPTRARPSRPPRIAVLGQLAVWATSTLDARITMRCYDAALSAIGRHLPDATVVLRPHPAQDRAATPEVLRRFAHLDIRQQPGGSITDFLQDVDLCIGGASTATLQGALVGTPVIGLNLSGWEWRFPLGGETSVPVARTPEELDAVLGSWTPGTVLPGRDDLLRALGAHGGDAATEMVSILARGVSGVAPRVPG